MEKEIDYKKIVLDLIYKYGCDYINQTPREELPLLLKKKIFLMLKDKEYLKEKDFPF